MCFQFIQMSIDQDNPNDARFTKELVAQKDSINSEGPEEPPNSS
jgi:hypothetical protein